MSFWATLNPRRPRFRTVLWVAVLVGVGCGVWFFSGPVPRWKAPLPILRAPPMSEVVSLQGFTPNAEVVTITEFGGVGPGDWQRTFSWWDLATGKEVRSFKKSCSYFAFSTDCRFLAAGDGERFWITDSKTGNDAMVAAPALTGKSMPELHFSRDGKYVARRHDDLLIVDSSTGLIRSTIENHGDNFRFVANTNRVVYFKSSVHLVQIWDTDANQPAEAFGRARVVGMDREARFLLTVDPRTAHAELIDLRIGRKILQISNDGGARDSWNAFAVSDDGALMALWGQRVQGKEAASIEFWSIPEGRKLSSLEIDYRDSGGLFSPDGSKIVLQTHNLWSTACDLRMIDVANGNLLWLKEFRHTPATVRFTPDSGALLVTSLPDDAIGFLDSATGEVQRLNTMTKLSNTFSYFAEPAPLSRPDILLFRHEDVRRAFRIPLVNIEFSLGTREELIVVDAEKRSVRLTLSFEKIADCGVSAHGPTLVTCHQEGGEWYLAAWDLPPAQPWLRIIGVPAGLWLVVAGLKWALRRRRSAKRQGLAGVGP
ncbi:MAG: hypothetical protein L0Y72_22015 [Gemmataceae bacterium]|nr:hypothetical protein [Gemmataceae bacterium]MCI0741718.1 hypothetical protein [Gemmataceae bacterium]